jgi:catechol 2,3-dioxygenase-like lactoylglutathione lyase family enzyme
MLNIQKIDHVGIRVGDKDRSVGFYAQLGFELITDAGFEQGHPVIMQHPSGVVLNLLGPSNKGEDVNILMDVKDKYAGYTHISLRIDSLEDAKKLFAEKGIEITGSFTFKNMNAIFIRDPDRNVIEFDEYEGDEPEARMDSQTDFSRYSSHP